MLLWIFGTYFEFQIIFGCWTIFNTKVDALFPWPAEVPSKSMPFHCDIVHSHRSTLITHQNSPSSWEQWGNNFNTLTIGNVNHNQTILLDYWNVKLSSIPIRIFRMGSTQQHQCSSLDRVYRIGHKCGVHRFDDTILCVGLPRAFRKDRKSVV